MCLLVLLNDPLIEKRNNQRHSFLGVHTVKHLCNLAEQAFNEPGIGAIRVNESSFQPQIQVIVPL